MPWESEPPTEKQLALLEENGFDRSTIPNKGYASKILDRMDRRYKAGLCTPKQMKFLQRYGYKNAGNWSRDAASATISMIYANNFRKPYYAKAY